MKIKLNNKYYIFKNKYSLKELVLKLNLKNKILAISVNRIIIQSCNWYRYYIVNKDIIEVVYAIGGG